MQSGQAAPSPPGGERHGWFRASDGSRPCLPFIAGASGSGAPPLPDLPASHIPHPAWPARPRSSAAGDGSADGELGEAFWAGAGYCGYLRESWGPGRAERTGVWSNPEYLRMVGMDMKELQRR